MSRLPFPAAVLDQHLIALGKTGSGKSSKVRVLVEHLLDQGKPVCILDPKGDWWGLKSSADGKSAGYPVVIFGGKHADVPVQPTAGAALAELIFTGNRPCIIDMREWRSMDRTKFFIDFAESAFKVTQGHRYLVISEVHNFAPKGKVLSPQAGDMLYWASRLASEGRGLGLTILADSQRPQKVHNDVLDSCETLIGCRTIHKSGREAIKDWIDGAADPEQGKEVLRDLASMTRPEAWVWSPEIGFGPKRITFPMFQTYDSFKPQSVSVKKLHGWAEVDLQEVSAKLSRTVAEAQANDPVALKKRVRELESKLTKAASVKTAVAPQPEATKAEIRTALSTIKNLRHLIGELMKFVVKINAEGFGKDAGVDAAELQKAIGAAVDQAMKAVKAAAAGREKTIQRLQSDAGRLIAACQKLLADQPVEIAVNVQHQAPFAVKTAPAPRPRPATSSENGDLSPVQRKILSALAEAEQLSADAPDRSLVAILSGYTHIQSTGFVKALGALSTSGLITYPPGGRVALTDAGRDITLPPDAPTTAEELQNRVIGLIGGAASKILRPLIDAHRDPMTRQDLATASGYGHVQSTGFVKTLGRLRTLGFIDYPSSGMVVAQPVLFLEGAS